jgi:hypothetical protein
MKMGLAHRSARFGTLILAVALCLITADLAAQVTPDRGPLLAGGTLGPMADSGHDAGLPDEPFSLLPSTAGGLDFDLGGSDTRKLQLMLDQPLSLRAGTTTRVMDSGSNLLGLDATLDFEVGDHAGLTAGVGRQVGQFQSVGSIRCMNGVLGPESYTASGCRFINEPLAASEQQQLDLGAYFDIGQATAAVNWFSRESTLGSANIRRFDGLGTQAALAGPLLTPSLVSPLLSGSGTDPLRYLDSAATGVNLNFKVGFTTDNSGDVRLGLAFSRVFEAEYRGLYESSSPALSWTLAKPFDTANMNLEWSRGSFSSGIQAYYRDSVNFLNRGSLDSLTTFDVHFTWRAPWNANLSVGASNVLNAGGDSGQAENQPADPLESIYGRIPYVRYKQDL